MFEYTYTCMYPPATGCDPPDTHTHTHTHHDPPACSVPHHGEPETFTFPKRPYWTQGVEFILRNFSTIWFCSKITIYIYIYILIFACIYI